jgi:peptidoglycan/xylan/chitin deacetylase (PgdA/CDA1 family)
MVKIPGKKFVFNIIDRWKSKLSNKGLILLYHKISDNELPDIFNLTVTPKNFEDHLEIINEIANPLSLNEYVSRLKSDTLPERSIAITFDDGYADNYENAFPLLIKNNIHATIFIASKYIGTHFWWEILYQSILKCDKKEIKLSNGLNINLNNDRLKLFTKLHKEIKKLQFDKIKFIVDELFNKSNLEKSNLINRGMILTELQEISKSNYIEIGGHTETHSQLSLMKREDQRNDIRENKKYLEENLNKKIKYFAYPYGLSDDYNNESINILKEEEFEAAFVNRNSAVSKFNGHFELPRLWVKDLSKDAFRKFIQSRLKK